MKKYVVYVDGFNLYYGLRDKYKSKQIQYKWLNLKSLVESFNFEDCCISHIRYFTARVKSIGSEKGTRQNVYLRALRTIPEITIHFGQLKSRNVKGILLEKGNPKHKQIVTISKFEEKGSDVNIATFMITDCIGDLCDVPVLISNDSDLSEPLKYIRTKLKKPVGLITPHDFFMENLGRYSSFKRRISKKQFRDSQFPIKLTDKNGTFHCPKKWR